MHPGNAVGLCNETAGYYGVLCTACLPGYKRSDTYSCEPCGEGEIFRTLIIMVFLVIGLCVLVKVTLAGAVNNNTHSVFNKILMNHA